MGNQNKPHYFIMVANLRAMKISKAYRQIIKQCLQTHDSYHVMTLLSFCCWMYTTLIAQNGQYAR